MLTEPRPAAAPAITHVVCGSGLHATVRVRGDLDSEDAPALARELDDLVVAGVREITIDLGPMAFMDRAAHCVVADFAGYLRDAGGRLTLARSAS